MTMWTDGQPVTHRRSELLVSTDRSLLDVAAVHDFLANRSYWAADIPLEVLRRAIDGSLCFGLYNGGRQVGFARVVTDGGTFAYLCDVFVVESHRGRGLCKWLLECVAAHPALQGLRRFVLITRDAHELYRRVGFTPLAEPGRYMEVWNRNPYGSRPAAQGPTEGC
jgi:GNAT superfamily N-acetyltransferase